MKNIAVLVGSLSATSINRTLARALEKLAAGRMEFDYLPLGDLPFYNHDLWQDPPAAVLDLKRRVDASDAVLIVMPEINRSFPALIKNALDWASVPFGQNSWSEKPLALAGASPGAAGTSNGQGHLRTTLPLFGFVVMGQPEVYFHFKEGAIDHNHDISDEASRMFLLNFIEQFDAWIDRHGNRSAVMLAAE